MSTVVLTGCTSASEEESRRLLDRQDLLGQSDSSLVSAQLSTEQDGSALFHFVGLGAVLWFVAHGQSFHGQMKLA